MNESKPMNERELKQIVNKGKSEELTDLEKIHKSKEILKKNVEKSKITFSKPIVTIDEKPFIYPRTINVIQGKSGTHKSRLAENLCSVILKGSNHGIDLLRMESSQYRAISKEEQSEAKTKLKLKILWNRSKRFTTFTHRKAGHSQLFENPFKPST